MTKLGIIGASSDWLISCHVDKEKCKNIFSIDLVEVTTDELIENVHKHFNDKCPENLIKASFKQSELDLAYQIYLGLNDIVEKYELKGFTIRCFDLLTTIHSTSCLALALFNDRGIIGTCEGDVPALISMYLMRAICDKPSFQANPSQIDVNNSTMIIAHCTLPLSMTTSYTLTTHFESGIGIGIKGELKEEDCAIFRIGPDLDKYVLLRGHILRNLNKNNLCRTQIEIKVNDDINYFLTSPLGNHHLVVYGKDFDKLTTFLSEKGLKRVN